MATNTPNYQFILPDVGGDDFAWGTMNNDNWTKADAKFKSIDDKSEAADAKFASIDARTINTNNGLTGGGDLSANRTFGLTGQALALHNLASNGFIARTGNAAYAARSFVGGDGVNVTNGSGVSGNPTVAVDATVVRTSHQVNSGDGLTGGGDLSTNRTLAVNNTVVRITGDQVIDGVKRFLQLWPSGDVRLTASTNAMSLRFDGDNFYILKHDTLGGPFNALRPLTINGTTGAVTFGVGINGNGAGLTGLNASSLGTGQVPDGRIHEATVRSKVSEGTAGQIGTYAMIRLKSGSLATPGQLIPASAMEGFASARGENFTGTPLGSWRCMGYVQGSAADSLTTLFLRVS